MMNAAMAWQREDISFVRFKSHRTNIPSNLIQAGLRCLLLSLLRTRLGLRTGICSWLGARIGRSAACMSLPATLAPSLNATCSSGFIVSKKLVLQCVCPSNGLEALLTSTRRDGLTSAASFRNGFSLNMRLRKRGMMAKVLKEGL